jgi:DNA-binding NtrC family response regulator
MSPALKSIVVPISEVPLEDAVCDEFGGGNSVRRSVVLVVDDERMVADTLTMIFDRAGFETFTAYNGKGALEIASGIAPDILVSDVDMPLMNGVELAMTMMRIVPKCRVLLFSGHATFADLASARASGYDFPLLPKPVHPSVMIESVSRCLEEGGLAPARQRMHRPVRMRSLYRAVGIHG